LAQSERGTEISNLQHRIADAVGDTFMAPAIIMVRDITVWC
jgi:hypothetical protein